MIDGFRTELDGHTDTIAERVAQLGGIALGSLQAVASSTNLKPYPTDIYTIHDHLDALIERFAVVANMVRKAIDEASEEGDPTTADIFTAEFRTLDKALWFLEAHFRTKADSPVPGTSSTAMPTFRSLPEIEPRACPVPSERDMLSISYVTHVPQTKSPRRLAANRCHPPSIRDVLSAEHTLSRGQVGGRDQHAEALAPDDDVALAALEGAQAAEIHIHHAVHVRRSADLRLRHEIHVKSGPGPT